ncbi:hypothetical protein B0H13DRAFT_1866236 [Mycena leptocephala]|nr:hypothetical protein B0H13DRAFT_1866236 [Mycena leptocephala]
MLTANAARQRVKAHRLIDFYTSVLSYTSRFLDRECIDLPALKEFLEALAAGDPNVLTCTDVSAAGPSRGHQHFIDCNGFTRGFNNSHTIPDYVDEEMLAKSLANQKLSDSSEEDT